MCNVIYFLLAVVLIHTSWGYVLHPRIFGGQEISHIQHKYLVQLLTFKRNGTAISPYSCSGSILNQRWIISAAHCYCGDFIGVLAVKFKSQLLGIVEKSHVVLYPEFKCSPRPNYLNSVSDLALLKTTNRIKFDEFTQPIRLSTRSPKIGESVVIAGYGHAEDGVKVPREGRTTVTECSGLKTTLICTVSTVRSGKGDSGGPLISNGSLVGVTSWGCDTFCTAYVDVTLHLDWINAIIFNKIDLV